MAVSPDVIKRLQGIFLDMGPSGIKHIPRLFEFLDKDCSQTVTQEEFSKGMTAIDIQVPKDELKEAFRLFDKDGSGKIDIKEFTKALEPKINENRQDKVKKFFEHLDKDGDGVITVQDLKTAHQGDDLAIQHFLETFEADDHRDGKVTFDEFLCYYKCVSAGIADDQYFVAHMLDEWGEF